MRSLSYKDWVVVIVVIFVLTFCFWWAVDMFVFGVSLSDCSLSGWTVELWFGQWPPGDQQLGGWHTAE